jgi:hypothetical protein
MPHAERRDRKLTAFEDKGAFKMPRPGASKSIMTIGLKETRR